MIFLAEKRSKPIRGEDGLFPRARDFREFSLGLGFGFYRLCLIFGKKKARGNLAGFPSFGSIINQRQTLFFLPKKSIFHYYLGLFELGR
jgi:hypothetical protein